MACCFLTPKSCGIDVGAELDFLDLIGVLMLARLFFLLSHFVAVFAEIDQTANRRGGIGRDLYQIHPLECGPC